MFKDITASLVAATRKVVEASSAKAANEAAQKEQSSALSKSMRPAYEGSAPRNAQEISLLNEKAPHTIPKTPNEKKLAALADDGKKDVITHADVMVGRGVKKEEKMPEKKKTDAFDYKSPRRPQDAPNRKSGDVTSTGHDVKKISTGMVYTKRFEEVETIDEAVPRGVKGISSLTGEPIHIPDARNKAHVESRIHHHLVNTHKYSKKEASGIMQDMHDTHADNGESHLAPAGAYGGAKPRSVHHEKVGIESYAKDMAKHLHDSHQESLKEAETIAEAPVDGVAPGSMEGDKHMCASKVMHKEWKEGKTLFSQHAEPNEIGLIEWYDVMFDHGIEKHVPTRDLEIMAEQNHMSHSKKKKM